MKFFLIINVFMIGIIDANEVFINKPRNRELESMSYSGKAGGNTTKTMAVIDRQGRYRFVLTGTPGKVNDRDQFLSSPLYSRRWEYFEGDQFLAADGIYRGDGNCKTSYTASELQEDTEGWKKLFNIAFTEFRKGVENTFGRTQMWFPILGNKKLKWNYDEYLFQLAFQAAARLHNWIVFKRNLNYDPTTDPAYLFTAYW